MANSSIQTAQSPSIISPMWIQPAGGEPHFDPHNLGLSKTPCGSTSHVPSFAPKTPCEGNASMNSLPLSSLEMPPGVTTLVPDSVGIPCRQRHKPVIGSARESAGKWLSHVQEHYRTLRVEHSLSPFVYAGTEPPIKRVKRKHVDQKVAHEMDKDVEVRTNRNVELDPSVLDDVRSSNGFHGASSSDQVIEKVLANMPIQESKAARLPHDLRSYNPSFPERVTVQNTERNTQCTHGASSRSLCVPTMRGNGGAAVVSSRKSFPLLQEERTVSMSGSLRIPQIAQVAERMKLCTGVSPRSVQETVPGRFLSSRTPQVLQGSDPGSLFIQRKSQGSQETDPGSLLGLRNTPHLECLSGRMIGSLCSPPLNIPTPNPVLKSTVGMTACRSPRRETAAKACENGKESKPLLCSGSMPHAVPVHSPMPVAKQTLSSGEPSLLLTLNFSPKPPGSTGLSPKSSTAVLTSPVEEWGKMLALSHTPAAAPAEVETSTTEHKHLLRCQERFIHLQAFLKKCDDEQEDLLQILQSLSAAARSGHAVRLETRAVGLSIEEGKEMRRVKVLNVMGRGLISRGRTDVGGTPVGPRLPALSTTLELGYQS